MPLLPGLLSEPVCAQGGLGWPSEVFWGRLLGPALQSVLA